MYNWDEDAIKDAERVTNGTQKLHTKIGINILTI